MINDLLVDCEKIAKRYESDVEVVIQKFNMIKEDLEKQNKTAPYIKVTHLTNKYFREQYYKSKGI
jgi:hypothetical protein